MILTTEKRTKLKSLAKREAKSLWEMGDLANEYIDDFRWEKKKKRLHRDLNEFQAWAEIAQALGKSSGRIQKIAQVAAAFQERSDKWGFGYYEKALDLPDPDEQRNAIDFLDFYEPEYGQRLKVGEFLTRFRQHILGENTTNVNIDDSIPLYTLDSEPTPIQALVKIMENLFIFMADRRGGPATQKMLELLDGLNEIIPEALKEIDQNTEKIYN